MGRGEAPSATFADDARPLPLDLQSFGGDRCCAVRAGKDARGLLTAHQAKGAGYAISRPEELQTVIEVAESTGAFSTASQLYAHPAHPSVHNTGHIINLSAEK